MLQTSQELRELHVAQFETVQPASQDPLIESWKPLLHPEQVAELEQVMQLGIFEQSITHYLDWLLYL